MISKLRAFGAFWYDFIIGDDWRIALGVTVAFALTYALSRATTAAIWWIIPVTVAMLLPASIYRVTHRST